MNVVLSILITLILSLQAIADKCANDLDTNIESVIVHRGVTLRSDPLFEAPQGESFFHRRYRESKALQKLIQMAAVSPDFNLTARDLKRGFFTLAINLQNPRTQAASKARLILEYSEDGGVFKLNQLNLVQASGKKFIMEKTPLISDGTSLKYTHIVWAVESYRNRMEKAVIDEVPLVQKTEKQNILQTWSVRNAEPDAIPVQIQKLAQALHDKQMPSEFDQATDAFILDIPLQISVTLTKRFEKRAALFTFASKKAQEKLRQPRLFYSSPFLALSFKSGLKAFIERGVKRAMNWVWLGLAVGGFYVYQNGIPNVSIETVNGVRQIKWSYEHVLPDPSEMTSLKNIHQTVGLPPLSESEMTRANGVIRGPIDIPALAESMNLKVTEFPVREMFTDNGMLLLHLPPGKTAGKSSEEIAEIIKSKDVQDGLFIITALVSQPGSGEPLLMSRFFSKNSNPAEFDIVAEYFARQEASPKPVYTEGTDFEVE